MMKMLRQCCCFLIVLLPLAVGAAQPGGGFDELRKLVFELDPAEIGITRDKLGHPVWGMVMETGFEDGSFSLVTLVDGTTSLYFSTGGGAIGAGEHEAVRDAVGHYLTGAQYFFDQAEAVSDYPVPDIGRVRFYFLSFDGVFAYESSERELGEGKDRLSNLFYAAHDVIIEVRKLKQ